MLLDGTTDQVGDRDACHFRSRVIIRHPHSDTMSELLAEIRKIPPVTRFVCASIVAVTLPVMTKLISPYKMIFVKEFVTKKWEVRSFRRAISACPERFMFTPVVLEDLHFFLPRRYVSASFEWFPCSRDRVESGINFIFDLAMQ